MNREIKFRAWNYSEMIYNVAVRNSLIVNHPDKFTYKKGESNYKIMQFTGLLDKNGNEIYEGDILSWESYEGKKHQTRWVVEYNSERGFKSWSSTKNDEIVIGNIHENPELLK